MENKDEDKLFIPPLIPDNNDYFAGIGAKEAGILGAGFGVAIIGIIFFFIITGNMALAILIPFACFALLFIMIRRDQYEESMVDKVKQIWEYSKAQKQFEFQYYDEWGFLPDEAELIQEEENDSK